MHFKELQRDMRIAHLGGGTGIFISGMVWIISGICGIYFSKETSILIFFLGGMLIYPSSVIFSMFLKRTGKHHKNNPLATLAIESTVILFVGVFLAYSVFHLQKLWFYPVMLMTIGIRYFVFQTIYGMKFYWILGLFLIIAGVLCIIITQAFYFGAITGGIIELLFGIFVIVKEKKPLNS